MEVSVVKNDVKLNVITENLALPEVHTGKIPEEEQEEAQEVPLSGQSHIRFETVAVPEIDFSGHAR